MIYMMMTVFDVCDYDFEIWASYGLKLATFGVKSHKYNSWNECIDYFQTYVQSHAYPGNFFEQKIWEVVWLLRGFHSKMFLKDKLFWNFFAYSESAWWADLKNGLIFLYCDKFWKL